VLDDIHVEGLIHITALKDDYYHFDKMNHIMKGERTGKNYQLGGKISIRVAAVSLDERKIDFVLKNSGPSRFERKKFDNKDGFKRGSFNKDPEKGAKKSFNSDKNAASGSNSASSEKLSHAKPEEKKQPKKKRKNRRRRWMN